MKLGSYILLLSIIFLANIHTGYAQKTAIIKQIGKYAKTEGLKNSGEYIAKKELKDAGVSIVEKTVARQTIRKIAREKLLIFVKEQGFKSFMEYANNNASKKLLASKISMYGKNAIKSSQSTYKASLLSLRKAQKYVKRTITRISISKKEQFIMSKDYISVISTQKVDLKFGYPKDANKLRENMLQCMSEKTRKIITDSKNKNQAHHIIGNVTPIAFAKLKKFNIDINDPMNGIFLPANGTSGLKGTVHHGGHKQDYYDYIENLFINCNTKQDCYDVLDKIKNDLYKGKIELYNTHKANYTFTNKKAA